MRKKTDTDSTVATIEPTEETLASVQEMTTDEEAGTETEPATESALAVVPWRVLEGKKGEWQQNQIIETWLDDKGTYPRSYRAYSKDEWAAAINTIAATVNDLPHIAPEYQHLTGLYVEEHKPDYLIVRGKKMQIIITVPAKANASTQRIQVGPTPGANTYGFERERREGFVEFLMTYIPADERDQILDIACQYMREIRLTANRADFVKKHPELADQLPTQS